MVPDDESLYGLMKIGISPRGLQLMDTDRSP
jgi:hypothetical protein